MFFLNRFVLICLEPLMTSRFLKGFVVLGLTAALAACGSSVELDETAGTSTGMTSSGAGAGVGTGAASGSQLDPFNPQSPLAQQRSVYFEFDSYAVTEQYRPVVEMHARYLSNNPQQEV